MGFFLNSLACLPCLMKAFKFSNILEDDEGDEEDMDELEIVKWYNGGNKLR